jgi:hypothetical protein
LRAAAADAGGDDGANAVVEHEEEEEVSFRAPVRVLVWKAWARTVVRQRVETRRGGARIDVAFSLLHSVSSRVWVCLGWRPLSRALAARAAL